MNYCTVTFGGGVSTLGMAVVKTAIDRELENRVSGIECRPTDVETIKNADIIFISLFWFENILDYFSWLVKLGINPENRKPLLVIGGISAINVRILHGYFHYCILGDGEVTAPDFIRAILDGSDPKDLPGVIKDGDFDSIKIMRTNPIIPSSSYVETREHRTARIELARGCRFKCAFCQLGNIKPYREQPIEVVEYLLKQAPTRNVGLFAPDRTGYSGFDRLEETCRRLGKINTAEDTRLDMLLKKTKISKVKFGIEGFSERSRKRFKKLASNEQILQGFNHIFNVLRTPKGKPITYATVYMIGDLPGETYDDWQDFWDLLRRIDNLCKSTFMIYFTLNSFAAKSFTPMEREGIKPYNDWGKLWKNIPRLPHIQIAVRGGMLGPANRIIHGVCLRGDERLTKFLFYIATKGRKIFKSPSAEAGRAVEKLIQKCGVDSKIMYEELPEGYFLPHGNLIIEPLDENKTV